MAMINNAHAGSQINLLCMIYRVIYRNNGKLSLEEITSMCRPDNLLNRKDHLKRFPENLRFWMKPEHQLWHENSESKLILSELTKSVDPLPSDIAVVTNKALFKDVVQNICNQESHDTESFFRHLVCIIASDRFVFPVDPRIENSILDNFFSEFFHKLPNNSEKLTFMEYGDFLGFFEKQGNGYLADPTRAIVGVLPDIFVKKDSLSINTFVRLLGEKIPVLDKGVYREEVEASMSENGWKKHSDKYLSKSLSHALFRLSRMKKIRFMTASDDIEALSLQLPENKTLVVSSIQYLNGDVQ
jgi:hypothetical protein